jgi:tetratricopeptide (TPR) repeat protein
MSIPTSSASPSSPDPGSPSSTATASSQAQVQAHAQTQAVAELRARIRATEDLAARGRLRVRLADRLAATGDWASVAAELRQAAEENPAERLAQLAARGFVARFHLENASDLLRACEPPRSTAPPPPRSSPAGGGASRPARPRPPAGKRTTTAVEDPVPRRGPAPPAPVGAAPAPIPAELSRPTVEPGPPPSRVDEALSAFAEGKPFRTRRLAEEAARLDAGHSGDLVPRLRALADAMEAGGSVRDALLLRRTLLESPDTGPSPGAAAPSRPSGPGWDPLELTELGRRASAAGERLLALAWSMDAGGPEADAVRDGDDDRVGSDVLAKLTSPPLSEPGALGGWRAFERFLVAVNGTTGLAGTVDDLDLAGTRLPGVVARALQAPARGSRSTGREDRANGRWPAHILWQRAFEAETDPGVRATLGARWVEAEIALSAGPVAAEPGLSAPEPRERETLLGILNLIIASVPAEVPGTLRSLRVEILRGSGDLAQLAVALGEDAESAPEGAARARLLAVCADVWEESGDGDLALDLRLRALAESPAEHAALVPARRRLESEGRRAEALELLVAAADAVTSPAEKVPLVRELARSAMLMPGARRRAAAAWLTVLEHEPDDAEARQGAERMLAETRDTPRLAELLAWASAREQQPARRAESLWRLAEFRRVDQQDVASALSLYRQLVELVASPPRPTTTEPPGRDEISFADEDWKRRDDALALHTARALAAPRPAQKAMALVDRATVLIDAGKLDAADRDLGRAMDLDISNAHAMGVLERLYEKRGDFRAFRKRLQARVGSATGTVAAQLWFGIGRANQRLDAGEAALVAYGNALAADARFAPAILALRRHAEAEGDYPRAVALLEREVDLARTTPELPAYATLALHVELGLLLLEKLGDVPRAADVLEVALGLDPAEPRALRAMFEARLSLGEWEAAAQALETMLTANVGVESAADLYYRVGRAAESAGQVDRALTLYSRSYARTSSYRPTLERLSEICFERQQWDNAWRATEHLRDRHGADLDPDTRAELALRAGLSDLHVAQRAVATQKISALLADAVPGNGLRDVADSWASMRLEPRLLGGIESERRGRILSRLGEVMSLTETSPAHPARQAAREVLAALALADRRWADALAFLDALAQDPVVAPRRRASFWITAGDLVRVAYEDRAGARERFRNAAALWPQHPGLGREAVALLADPGG